MNANTIVQKLWRLCSILRNDGISYQQYVTELTYLLFLKMMQEREKEVNVIPATRRWTDLLAADGLDKLQLYKNILADLGNAGARIGNDDVLLLPISENTRKDEKLAYLEAKPLPRMVQTIFGNASTCIREPQNLTTLVTAIDDLHWFSEERDQLGDLYEGLLQKNAEETKRGAGQYFTPRVLIDVLVNLMQPQPGEIIQDPATGAGGFLIAADKYMQAQLDDGYFSLSPKKQKFQFEEALHGLENVPGTFRLLLMNLYLHGQTSEHVNLGDTLSKDGANLAPADLILTNPPFGPAGGKPTREDISVTKMVSVYQLPFVEHCIRGLKPGGRAAIIVPDNVLFESGRGKELRQLMMEWCDLHTILRLPTGIFYAQNVKTNVLFLQRGKKESGNTKKVWVYDLRTQMPQFGKTSPFTQDHLKDFAKAYGTDVNGKSNRKDEGEEGRFRCFTRADIEARENNLDITWLQELEEEVEDGLVEPEDIAAAILGHLQSAMVEIESLNEKLLKTHTPSAGVAE